MFSERNCFGSCIALTNILSNVVYLMNIVDWCEFIFTPTSNIQYKLHGVLYKIYKAQLVLIVGKKIMFNFNKVY